MSTDQLKDLLSGELATIATVAKRRTGKRPSSPTIFRWIKKGLRGGSVKLSAVFHAGEWLTTDAAFERFLEDQTEAAFADTRQSSTSDDDLRAMGLL